MTGPEHYLAAERGLEAVKLLTASADLGDAEGIPAVMATLAVAQVHATLAVAAATGLAASDPQAGLRTADAVAWERVASAAPPEDDDTDGQPS